MRNHQTLDISLLTEYGTDTEMQEYLLKAYLQYIHGCYKNKVLYPTLSALRATLKEYMHLQHSIEKTRKSSEKLIGIDVNGKQKKLIYRSTIEKPEFYDIIVTVIKECIHLEKTGREILEEESSLIKINPVGLLSSQILEGFLLIHPVLQRKILLFNYSMPYISLSEVLRINVSYITTFSYNNIASSYETYQKICLEKYNKFLYYPSCFVATTNSVAPMHATILPVVQQKLFSYIHNL